MLPTLPTLPTLPKILALLPGATILVACTSPPTAQPGRDRVDAQAARPAGQPITVPVGAGMCELAACERACAERDARACFIAGYRYNLADGAPHDDPRALTLYNKACEGHVPQGCFGAGSLYEDGTGGTVDIARASALYDEACRDGFPKACRNLGRFYRDGKGRPRDPERANTLFRAACEAAPNSGGCNELGLSLERGVGIAKDARKAGEAYERGCTGEDWDACTNLGVLLSNDSTPAAQDRAIVLFERACAAHRARTVRLRETAVACLDLARTLRTRKTDDAKAVAAYQDVCDIGYTGGCGGLALMVAEGRGTAADPARAAALNQRACDASDGSACNNLARAYYKGVGVPVDRARAIDLFKRACVLKDETGCANARNAPP
jgi:hypothetical protein